MKYLLIIAIIFMGCVTTSQTKEQQDARIRYKLEKQLDHERLVRECYQCDCCKGRYKVYNRSYKKK